MVSKSKAHLVFPEDLLQAIDKLVGKRRRSKFVVEAARKELKRVRFVQALQEAAGSWQDEDHPELRQQGTYRWVREQREADEARSEEVSR